MPEKSKLLRYTFGLLFVILNLAFVPHLCADAPSPDTEAQVLRSPKPGWGDFEVIERDDSYPWWAEILLWPVNRILDFTDAFHFDVGAGTSKGGVVRITRYANAGYREVEPGSLRIGSFGRDYPVMIEQSNEHGIGPNYVHSKDRDVCKDEIGIGLDLFVGAYIGFCPISLFDFVTGIFFLDPEDDDIR